jgi:hypothetical protein
MKSGRPPDVPAPHVRVRHCSRGFSRTTVSTIESGAGSVGVSARPTLPSTALDLGEAPQDRVLALELARASSIEMPGRVVGM